MAVLSQRCSFISAIVGSIFLLGFACVALRPNRQLSGDLPKSRFHSILPKSGTYTHLQSHIPDAPVFDPVLAFATYLGGQGGTSDAAALLVDSAGNSFIAGTTGSTFSTTPGVIGVTNPVPGSPAVGLYKVDPTGKTLIFATYLPGLAQAEGIAFDSAGNIYVAGQSLCITPVDCPNFDVLPSPAGVTPYQSSPRSIAILKLNSTATSILGASYLGGSSRDVPYGIATDADGALYITGYTSSNDFPTLNPIQGSLGASGQSAFVTKFNPTLSALGYSTYLGQDTTSQGISVAVDSSKDAFVTGDTALATSGNNFPLTQNAFSTNCNAACGFLSELSPNGSALLYSTYAGITANAVAVDTNGNAFIGGMAQAPYSFSQSLGPCLAQGSSSFVAEVSSAGTLSFSTCLGGEASPNLGVTRLTLDSSGNVYAVGVGASGMTLKNPIQTEIEAGSSFVAGINPNSSAMLFASYFGGADIQDAPSGVGVDSSGNVYVTGTDTAEFGQPPLTIFPVFNAAQPVVNTPGCGTHIACQLTSAYLLKIAPTDAPAAAVSPGGLTFPVQAQGVSSTSQTVTIYDEGSSPLVISDIAVTGDFQIQMSTPCQTTIPAAGGSCSISVSFTPTAFGSRTGALTLTDNSAGSPHTVQLTGTGGQGAATLAPTTLSFDSQALGTTSQPQTVTLTNSGSLSLQISHIGISGPFSETNNCGTTLGPSSTCTVSVTFAPTAAGSATGTLTLADSAADSPQTVELSGNSSSGIGLNVPSGGSASATVTAGATATYALAVGGTGMSGTASLSCTGTPAGAACSVPKSVTINATKPTPFNVSVTTTAGSQMLPFRFEPGLVLWMLALLGCLVFAKFARAASALRPAKAWAFAPILALTLCACGGGGSNSNPTLPSGNSTSAGTYTIVVTATSGSTTQSQSLTLVVK